MGHYDSQREAYDDEVNKRRLDSGRKTITHRLRAIHEAMTLLGMSSAAAVVYEAIEHLEREK